MRDGPIFNVRMLIARRVTNRELIIALILLAVAVGDLMVEIGIAFRGLSG